MAKSYRSNRERYGDKFERNARRNAKQTARSNGGRDPRQEFDRRNAMRNFRTDESEAA